MLSAAPPRRRLPGPAAGELLSGQMCCADSLQHNAAIRHPEAPLQSIPDGEQPKPRAMPAWGCGLPSVKAPAQGASLPAAADASASAALPVSSGWQILRAAVPPPMHCWPAAGRMVIGGARPSVWPRGMSACVGLALHMMQSPPLAFRGQAAPLVDAAAPSCSAARGAGDKGCQLAPHQLEVSRGQPQSSQSLPLSPSRAHLVRGQRGAARLPQIAAEVPARVPCINACLSWCRANKTGCCGH